MSEDLKANYQKQPFLKLPSTKLNYGSLKQCKSPGSRGTPTSIKDISYNSMFAHPENMLSSTPAINESENEFTDGGTGFETDCSIDDHYPYASDTDLFDPETATITTCGSLENVNCREERALLQATVFVEDALEHRSIHHKIDTVSMLRYRIYHSKPVIWILRITIFSLLILAFAENPSSLTISSDPRVVKERLVTPCGATESVELLCLIILSCDWVFKLLIVGRSQAKRSNWLIAYGLVLTISYLDWLVSISYECNERYRVRRLLRPFFLIQNSSLMKKTVQCIQRSIPQILSVLFLLCLHMYFFTMLGMVLFSPRNVFANSTAHHGKDSFNDIKEGQQYFEDIGSSIISLLVLLTTANNPDVRMPAYSDNRLYSIFFVLFVAIGLYFFMNVLLAVIYNQFKGSFSKSMQQSFLRRRVGVRAAFEVLRGSTYLGTPMEVPSSCITTTVVKSLIENIRFAKWARYKPRLIQYLDTLPGYISAKQFQELFDLVFMDTVKRRHPCRQFENQLCKNIQAILLHNYFQYFGDFMSVVNVLVVTIELSTSAKKAFGGRSKLSIINFCFIFYYAVEQIMMIIFIGPKRYFSHKHIWFESITTWLLVLSELLSIALYGGPFPYLTEFEIEMRSANLGILSLWNLLRITNMLIIIRLLRIIPSIKPLAMISKTLVDLVQNMRAFGGIMVFIYYTFAILGIMVFEGRSPLPSTVLNNITDQNVTCGTYQQLDYFANNFDDFFSAIILLWDVMVVNNWHIYLAAYVETTGSRYSQIFFIVWWLVSAVICINLFIALVIEAFITQWDKAVVVYRKHKKRKYAHDEETSRHFRVFQMFQSELKEPTEEEIWRELRNHHSLRRYTLPQNSGSTLQD